MALRLARIPIITEPVFDVNMAIDSINIRIDEINRIFQEIELEHAKQKGNDTNKPAFFNDLNLQNNRLTNVARSKDPQDAVTRRELEEIGILGNRADGLNITGDLTVDGSITINGSTGGASEVATGSDVENSISAAIGANVATSVSGEIIVEEDALGANGTTEGTLAMAKNNGKKAEFLQMINGELVVRDHELHTLLEILIEEVRALRNAN